MPSKNSHSTITSPNARGSAIHDIEVILRSTSLKPSWLMELLSPPPPLTLTDCRSDEMTGDQWRSHPLKWLQVSLQGYPPCLICRRAPVGPRHPLISRSEGKEALLSKSSTGTFEWQQGRLIGGCRANCSHNHRFGDGLFSVVIISTVPFRNYREASHTPPRGSIAKTWSWFDMLGPSSPHNRKRKQIRWNNTIFTDQSVGLVLRRTERHPLQHLQMLSKGGPCLHWGAAQTKKDRWNKMEEYRYSFSENIDACILPPFHFIISVTFFPPPTVSFFRNYRWDLSLWQGLPYV